MISLKQQKNAEFARPEYFTQSGRSAFKKAIQLLGVADGTILLPAYIGITDKEGSGVLDPTEESGASYEFYALDKRLSPDMEDLAQKIAHPGVRAVLVIHYFGFPPENFGEVVALCKKHNKLLVEDCAHALASSYKGQKLGTFGDAAFYSLHKYLAVESGGLLRLPANTDPALQDDIDEAVLAEFARAEWERIAAVRRSNYEYVAGKLRAVKPFFASLPEGVVPMNFPIWVDGMDRNDFYFKLQELGVPTSTLYYRLVQQIDEGLYPLSYDISRHINNLPIHQSMSREDLDAMLEAVHTVLGV